MNKAVYPIWVFVAVAFAIALAAFVVAQFQEGAGMIVVGLGTLTWAAFVARKGAMARGSDA